MGHSNVFFPATKSQQYSETQLKEMEVDELYAVLINNIESAKIAFACPETLKKLTHTCYYDFEADEFKSPIDGKVQSGDCCFAALCRGNPDIGVLILTDPKLSQLLHVEDMSEIAEDYAGDTIKAKIIEQKLEARCDERFKEYLHMPTTYLSCKV